jgi:ABC-type transport system involved in cytochrome c biogenesis permease component
MGDAASLFVILFGVPSLLLAAVFAAIALKAPRGGAVLCGLLLASVAPLLVGVDRVSYMKGAGPWLMAAVAIAAAGLVISLIGMVRGPRKPAPRRPGEP